MKLACLLILAGFEISGIPQGGKMAFGTLN